MSEDRGAGGEPEDELEIPEDDPEPEDLEPPGDPDEPDPEPDETEPALAPAPRQRGNARVQALANENRALKERQVEFERQLRDLTARQREPSPAERAEADRQERERFEMLSPWEQAQELRRQVGGAVQSQVRELQSSLWDQNDKAQYDGLLAANPKLKRYAEVAEEARKQAPGISRKVALAYAIGQAAMENLTGAETRSRNRAQVERERNRGTPSASRPDVPATVRGRSGASLEDRLRGQKI